MENYKLTSHGVIRLSDNAFIRGPDANNADWIAFAAWLDLGNTPMPEYTIEQIKTLKKNQINADCASTIIGGFSSSALGSPHKYDSDIEDQINLIASFIASQALAVVPYRCTEIATGVKDWKNHTQAQITQLYFDGMTFKTTQLVIASQLKFQVDNAATQNEVGLISWGQ